MSVKKILIYAVLAFVGISILFWLLKNIFPIIAIAGVIFLAVWIPKKLKNRR
jgi:hypothetical protein